MTAAATDVIDFWFGEETSTERGSLRELWFRKNAAVDVEISSRFGTTIEAALRGELDGWDAEPVGALARIVLLDQFTRNVFRDSPRAFAGDPQAIAAARAMVGSRQDQKLPTEMRSFVYVPFEHAEGLATQEEGVRLFAALAETDPRLAEMLDYAKRHRDIIERFGRFPHRNAILGRRSSQEEREFLETWSERLPPAVMRRP